MFQKRNLFNPCRMITIAVMVLGISIFLLPGVVLAQYSGPESCTDCHATDHETNLNDWRTSGHPNILMKGEDAQNRAIPLPGGFTWNDISYVVGGHGRKTLYLDNNGYIITTTKTEGGSSRPGFNQYNTLTGEWSDYRPGEANLPYDCGSCHTTNYSASGHQDGLAGIVGTFDSAGVECEQCHGNGMEMNINNTSAFCGTCHTSGASSAVIPAKDGFIVSEGQYNELLAGPHDNVKCISCHNPHKPAKFSIVRECSACHGNKVDSFAKHSMADYGVECKDCHMPYATLSAQAAGVNEGDRRTHIFYINSDPAANMFNEAGDFVALDNEGNAAVTLNFTCKRCHATADINELGRFAKNFHGKDTAVSQLEYIGLNPGLSGNWWGGPDRNGEGFLMEVAQASGNMVLIVSFYTYDKDGNQVWLIAAGPATTGMTANVDVFISSGRKWGEGGNQADFTTSFGTGSFTFPACDVGSFTLTPNAEYMALGFTSIGYDLSRDIAVSKIACPTFVNNAN